MTFTEQRYRDKDIHREELKRERGTHIASRDKSSMKDMHRAEINKVGRACTYIKQG